MTTTDKLLKELNSKNNKSYPEIGYFYFADIKGDGRNIKSVYQVINENGGVSYAHELNSSNSRTRCKKIRQAIKAA